MSRLIVIVVIFVLVYLLLKSYRRHPERKTDSKTTEEMVACVYCGINLPKKESISVAGKYYCCTAHSLGQPEKK